MKKKDKAANPAPETTDQELPVNETEQSETETAAPADLLLQIPGHLLYAELLDAPADLLLHQRGDVVPQIAGRNGLSLIIFQTEAVHMGTVCRRQRIGGRKDGRIVGVGI